MPRTSRPPQPKNCSQKRAPKSGTSARTSSGVLYTELAAVLPSMAVLATDPVHVVINVEMGYGRRRTRCSKHLRIIMNKISKSCVVRGIQEASGGVTYVVRPHAPT